MSDDVPAYAPKRPRRLPISATTLLIVANVGWFLFMWRHGVDPRDPDPAGLVRYGAIERTLVRHGEWWRLASAMFVHVGFVHILVNMISLTQVGPLVERLFGRGPYLALYLLTGLCASVASVAAHKGGVSAGASGAIFGIVGGLVAFLVRVGRHVFEPGAVGRLLRNLVFVIGINLAIGFTVPMIDNAAHLGGLVAGLAIGAALAGSATPDSLSNRYRRAWVVSLVALVALAGGAFVLIR